MSTPLAPLNYVDCDIPDGTTLAEWRRSRAGRTARSHRHPIRRVVRRLCALT